jgi:membrane-associated phospholipid phosphatase
MWQTWVFSEVLFKTSDPLSFLLALVSLVPLLSLVLLFIFVAVPCEQNRNAARLLIILLLNEAVCQILKRMFKQSRPTPPWDPQLIEMRRMQLGYGMPSSHTALMFCCATTTALLPQKAPTRFRIWRVSVWVLAILVAISRIYNGYHTFFQVLVGAIVGAGSAWALVQPRVIKTSAIQLVKAVQSISMY